MPDKKIVVTQPRRVAAMSLAQRLVAETGSEMGKGVGYKIRFEDETSKDTKIAFLTDGMLLREAQIDKKLSKYSICVLDEAHERSLHTDILFGVLKNIMKERPEFKLVVMSATLEAHLYATFFEDYQPRMVYISGRQHPVDIYFTKKAQKDYLDAVIIQILSIHLYKPGDGDILVFLTGQDEILSMQSILEKRSSQLPKEALKLIVKPLFSALPSVKQREALKPLTENEKKHCRKVILATNIAETSITIPDIKYVVDAGVVKVKQFSPSNKVETLQVVPISQAMARQRAGRAGRERAGVCYRLYTEDEYDEMPQFSEPEIKRANLSNIILQMKSMGITDPVSFDYLEPPPKETLQGSIEQLFLLGALNKSLELTLLGAQMAKFPLDPQFSLMLLKATKFGCVQEMLTILSLLSIDTIFYTPITERDEANAHKLQFASKYGDHITYLYVYKHFQELKTSLSVSNAKNIHKTLAEFCTKHYIDFKNMMKVQRIREQLSEYMRQLHISTHSSCGKDLRNFRRCLLAGGFTNVAIRDPKTRVYRTLTNAVECDIHPSSIYAHIATDKLPEYVLFDQVTETSKPFMRNLCRIEREWLFDVGPKGYFAQRIPRKEADNIKLSSKKSDL
eukprot:CAMPEP_0117419492 /NCGR_PEP_ID=MMETSP0758-20121206/1035_1 /TAXON_ID=63605 /ORGANISM="Percolomonas cosmopolitus, Strain AE-1 (ATCC 50343)" /LENGTH=621 /DNA_ID=CAMNT_0005200573 /DNA_START=209 /DNA_END=2071 /DNA_ORIENTATION=+